MLVFEGEFLKGKRLNGKYKQYKKGERRLEGEYANGEMNWNKL